MDIYFVLFHDYLCLTDQKYHSKLTKSDFFITFARENVPSIFENTSDNTATKTKTRTK